MAWGVIKVKEQRENFIKVYLEKTVTVTDLSLDFGISRRTAYKWISRFESEGFEGLKDLSRAPHIQAKKTEPGLAQKIVEVRLQEFQHKWGPKKILAHLKEYHPSVKWPGLTTIGKILDENGLTIPRKYRKRFPARTNPLSHCKQPNDVWTIDFKGGFMTKDHINCDPLTLTDAYSRYIFHCSKLGSNNVDNVWEILSGTFYEYGLPTYLRHDNGPPFATCSAGRLSRLSVNLIKAGVIPEWIDPGKPYQNGRHERMHSTLKQECIHPMKLTLEEQQMKFKEFLNHYNFERPHEGIGQNTPASIYTPSSREWKGKLKSPEYSHEYKPKKVSEGGQIFVNGTDVFIGKTLKNEYLGLKENEEGNWDVFFGPIFLGIINHESRLAAPQPKRKTNKHKCRVY